MTGPDPGEALDAHLALATGPWLGFVFAEDDAALQRFIAAHPWPGARVLRPATPQQLREGVPRLLEAPEAPLTWWAACFPAEPDSPWGEAADWFLLRANERRQPLLQHLQGGLLVALPRSYRARVPVAAPDLWSVRALVLDLAPPPPPVAPPPPVDRRIDELLRRLAFQQRMRRDPWHVRVHARTEGDRARVGARVAGALPNLVVRPDGPEALWIGRPPGETAPSLVVDLDAPLPPGPDTATPSLPADVDALGDVDALLQAAAATWSQGWASECLELAERALAALPARPGPDDDRRRADALELAARAHRELGDSPAALDALHHAVRLRRHRATLHGDDLARRRRELARALSLRGQLLLEGRDPEQARADLEEALALRQELARWSDDPESLAELALAHSLTADLCLATEPTGMDALRRAEQACREALALRRRVVDAVDAPRHRRQLGLAWGRLGRVLARALHLGEAERAFSQAVSEAEAVVGAAPLPVHQVEESVARTQLAAIRWQRGDLDGARQEVERAIAQRRQLVADDPGNARWAERLAVALGQGAQQALDSGELGQALRWAEEAVAVGEQLAPATAAQLRGLALAHLRLGDVHAASGHDTSAREAWSDAAALLPSLEARSPTRAAKVREALALRAPQYSQTASSTSPKVEQPTDDGTPSQ